MDDFGASPLGLSKKNAVQQRYEGTQVKQLQFHHADQADGADMDDVLYGDLVEDDDRPSTSSSATNTLLKLKVSKLQSEMAAKESVLEASEATVRDLREEVRRLREKNETLEYNISSLFNTAKLEIERKDAEIQRGRKEIARLTGTGGTGGGGARHGRSHSSGRPRVR
jgi:predicted RNase H-like nuclease (RuvC/YqgF family)